MDFICIGFSKISASGKAIFQCLKRYLRNILWTFCLIGTTVWKALVFLKAAALRSLTPYLRISRLIRVIVEEKIQSNHGVVLCRDGLISFNSTRDSFVKTNLQCTIVDIYRSLTSDTNVSSMLWSPLLFEYLWLAFSLKMPFCFKDAIFEANALAVSHPYTLRREWKEISQKTFWSMDANLLSIWNNLHPQPC